MNLIKNKLKQKDNHNLKFPYKKNKTIKNIKFNNDKRNQYNYENENYEDEENLNINTESNCDEQISNKVNNVKRDNNYFTKLNRQNINDLDAIYFCDKIQNNKTSKTNQKNGGVVNLQNNKGDLVPQLNLDPDYIEECKTKELLKLEEENLTPFQRIALQFEIS